MIASTFLFGVMNVIVKQLTRLPSYELVLFRSLVMLIVSGFLLYRSKIYPFGRSHRWVMIGRGVSGSIALMIFFFSIQHLPLATAVTVGYLSPIFTIIFATVLLKESLNWRQWIFFGISFIGILFINGLRLDEHTGLILLGILGAAFSGLAYNALRKTANFVPAMVMVFYLPLCTIPIVLPFCLNNWVMPIGKEWGLIIAMGLVTQVAQVYMTKAYQMEKAGTISNYAYLGVVFALMFGYIFFGERFNMIAIIGMLVVIVGIILNFLYVNRVTSAKRFKAYFRFFPGW
jgi:drug/metabolite transporter (DMT)-like permease